MKKALITLGIAAFLLGLMIYIGINYSPYDANKLTDIAQVVGINDPQALTDNIGDLIGFGLVFQLVDTNVFYVMLVLGFALTVCLVGGLHMLVEKLFYKRFYEEPRVWPAIRRGVILYIVFIGLLFFRLIDGLTWQNAVLIVILGVVLEFLLTKFTDKHKQA